MSSRLDSRFFALIFVISLVLIVLVVWFKTQDHDSYDSTFWLSSPRFDGYAIRLAAQEKVGGIVELEVSVINRLRTLETINLELEYSGGLPQLEIVESNEDKVIQILLNGNVGLIPDVVIAPDGVIEFASE